MVDIPHSRPLITKEDEKAIAAVLESGMIAEGELVRQFEAAMSDYLGLSDGVVTSSGTNALFLALKALGVGTGNEVILPTYVCRSVWDAVSWTGAKPVLCDVGDDWCMNVEKVKPLVTQSTRAIIVVYTFGIAVDIRPICRLGIPLIEDCCQALGARFGERMVGTFAEFCVLSFHATKLLATGEGGMVLTNDPDLLQKVRGLRHGKPSACEVRYRFPMTDIQAALGLSQLKRYDGFIQRRRAIANYYFSELEDVPIRLPLSFKNRSIFFRFPLGIGGRFEELRRLFKEEGIHVRRGVDTLLHRLLNVGSEGFPVAERCFAETLSIPLYPALTDEACQRVVDACQRIFGRISVTAPCVQ